MYKSILLILLMFILAGCATSQFEDGYQFGDLTAAQQEYCATADPDQRANLLALMRLAGVRVPPSGICTNLATGDLLDADVERAEADQQEWRERLDQ